MAAKIVKMVITITINLLILSGSGGGIWPSRLLALLPGDQFQDVALSQQVDVEHPENSEILVLRASL